MCLATLADAKLNQQLRKHEGSVISVGHHKAAPQHRLRVCNAYPYQTPLNVFIGEKRLTEPSMAYKTCRDFATKIKAKDKIDFRFKEATAGTFVVNDLPGSDAVLMLVIYRHNIESTAVAFESHVFANLLNAQIAVLDTYKGPETATLKIQDQQDAETSRSESLTPNSVVAVNRGTYEVVLVGADGTPKARSDFTVDNRESCVVVRCGVQPRKGRAYPQDLMVFPVHPPSSKGGVLLRSGANRRFGSWASLAAINVGALLTCVSYALA